MSNHSLERKDHVAAPKQPSLIKRLLQSTSAKTITALAGLLAAEASKPAPAQAQETEVEMTVSEDFTSDYDGWDKLSGSAFISDHGYLVLGSNGRVVTDPVPRKDGEVIRSTIVARVSGDDRFIVSQEFNEEGGSVGSRVDIKSRDYLGFLKGGQLHKRKTGGKGTYTVVETLSDAGLHVAVTRPDGSTESMSFDPVDSHSYTPAVYGWKSVMIDSIHVTTERPVAEEPEPEHIVLSNLSPEEQQQNAEANQPTTGTVELSNVPSEPEAEEAVAPLYSRMHVTQGVNAETLHIQFMTPADNAEFIVETHNNTTGGHHTRRISSSHQNGTATGSLNFSLHGITSSGTSITVSMVVNGQVVDQVNLRQGNTSLAGGSDWEWGDIEEGRQTQNALPSAMEIVATNGGQLSIAAQTAYDGVSITMEGGGYLSKHNASTEGGSSMFMQNFAFNTSNPSGVYKIRMVENKNGMVVSEISFYWDAHNKTITPQENEQSVAALQQEGMRDYINQMQSTLDGQAELGNIDVGFTSLRTVQRTMFSERSRYFLPDSEFDAILANFPIQGHPDAGSILNEGMAVYNETLGELLQEAAKVAIAAWNGEDQEAAVEAFHRRYNELSNLRKLNEFKIDFGVSFPSANQILQDGLNIAQEYLSDLQAIQAKEISMNKRSAYLAGIADPETDEELTGDAFKYNEFVVIMAHGEGSPEHLAYLETWGQRDGDTFEDAVAFHKEYLAAEHGENSKEYIDATKEYLEEVDTQVLSYRETYTFIQFDLEKQVNNRLAARLDAMSVDERAEARGLLRLKEDGLLDEYFRDLFHGTVDERVDAELEVADQNYEIYYLIDTDFADDQNLIIDKAGHAGILVGSDLEGWSYFSFGIGATGENNTMTWQDWVTSNGNIDADYFSSLEEAKFILQRYEYSLSWQLENVDDARRAFREASNQLVNRATYNALSWNCDDVASEIIRAAGIDIDNKLIPNLRYDDFENQELKSWRSLLD